MAGPKKKHVNFTLADWQLIEAAAPPGMGASQYIRQIVAAHVPGFVARKHGGDRVGEAWRSSLRNEVMEDQESE